MSLLALLSQPVDQSPTSVGGVDVAWSAAAPVLVLVGGALLLLAAGALSRRPPISGAYALFTVTTAGFAAVAAVPLWQRVQDADRGPFSTLAHSVGVDGFSVFVTFTICAAVILSSLLLDGWLRREGMEGTEPYVLVLLSASGGVMMASANDLIVMFLGLEILSLAVYVLAAMHLRKVTSQEAGVKYFVLGAFSSAFFLYGIALVYGATGSTNLVEISAFLSTHRPGPTAGCSSPAWRCSSWASGSRSRPSRSTSGRPTCTRPRPRPAWRGWPPGVKVAGFAGLLRVFYLAFGTYSVDWQPIVYALAALTLIVGFGAGHRADRREADAGLLVDQPRGLRPRGRAGGQRPRGSRRRSSTWPPTRSWSPAASASSPSSAARATSATAWMTTGASRETGRCWPWRSRCSCSPRRACRSRPGSSPSST